MDDQSLAYSRYASAWKNIHTRRSVPAWNLFGNRDAAVYGDGSVCNAGPALSLRPAVY